VRIPALLAAYNQKHTKVELDLSTGPSGTMIEGVLSGRLAAAFVDGPVLHATLEGVAVFEEEMVVIAPLHHAPITRGQDVNGQNIYTFRSNCSYRHHFERWFAQDGAVPGKIFEIESYHGMLACQRRCRPGADATQHAGKHAGVCGGERVAADGQFPHPAHLADLAAGHGVTEPQQLRNPAGRTRPLQERACSRRSLTMTRASG
jgi:hypothetical protein